MKSKLVEIKELKDRFEETGKVVAHLVPVNYLETNTSSKIVFPKEIIKILGLNRNSKHEYVEFVVENRGKVTEKVVVRKYIGGR